MALFDPFIFDPNIFDCVGISSPISNPSDGESSRSGIISSIPDSTSTRQGFPTYTKRKRLPYDSVVTVRDALREFSQ